MARKAIALVRVSSEEQAQEGRAGLVRQQRDIAAIAKHEGLDIVETFSLEGVSGSTVKLHPKFKRMLADVTKADIAGLVISSPDRLMRADDLADLAVLAPFGCKLKPRLIWTAESVYDLRSLDGQLMFLMKTLMGGHERQQISKRTLAGKQYSRERGDKCADKPPKGIEFVVVDPQNRTGFYRYTPDSKRVVQAFKRVLDRDTSNQAIAKELGFNSYQSMRKQLTNPIWTGYRVSDQRRDKIAPGPNGELKYKRVARLVPIRTEIKLDSPPLIDQKTFDEVQAILAGINKEHVTKRSGKSKFELSGLLRCPCGQRYYSKHDDREGKSGYYVCKSGYFSAAKKCGYPILNRRETDEFMVNLLLKTVGSKQRLVSMLSVAAKPKDTDNLKEERVELRRRVETLTGKRTKLVDKVADGVISDSEAQISMAKIRSDIDAAEARLREIESKLKVVEIPNVRESVTAIVGLLNGLPFKTTERRRAVIRQLISDVQIGADKQIASIRLRVGEGQTIMLDIGQ